jgi:hypothetical protein
LGTPVGVLDANSADLAEEAGQTLADFETGVTLDPLLTGAESTAFAHSWGLANVTSAEMHGATYDSVISLSGAWMPENWTPNPNTSYADFSYWDILQAAQSTGVVGEGNNPPIERRIRRGAILRGTRPGLYPRLERPEGARACCWKTTILSQPTASLTVEYSRTSRRKCTSETTNERYRIIRDADFCPWHIGGIVRDVAH